MKVKALIVDDERRILLNLKSTIDWAKANIELIGTAENGREAMEKIEKCLPDLIISDIRMPEINGLKMLEMIRERRYNCRVIFLTAYSDFAYARSALKLGAIDYVLKPIDYEELNKLLGECAEKIRLERSVSKSGMQRLANITDMAYEYLFLEQAEAGDEEATAAQQAEEFLHFGFIYFCSKHSEALENDAQYMKAELLDALSAETVLNDRLYVLLRVRNGEWCLLLEQKTNETLFEFQWFISTLSPSFREKCPTDLDFYLHKLPIRIKELRSCYREARQEASLGFSRMEQGSNKNEVALLETCWNGIESLEESIKLGSAEEIKTRFDKVNQILQRIQIVSSDLYVSMRQFTLMTLIRDLRDSRRISEFELANIAGRLQSNSLNKLWDQMEELISNDPEGMDVNSQSKNLLDMAKGYIDEHFMEDIGVEQVADKLGIGYSYFIQLFKRRFDKTFVEYVTSKRIEQAQQLLAKTKMSVTRIGKMVGYEERRYFSKVFKRHVGCLPSEYRSQLINTDIAT